MVAFHIRNELTKAKRIVIKVGTNVILDDAGRIKQDTFNSLIRQVHELVDRKIEVVIVSSGAIGLGNRHLNWQNTDDIVLNQCAASVGQNLLINMYAKAFQEEGIDISQLLLTHENINDEAKRRNIRLLIEKLMGHNIVTVINENDSISTAEITFGDNDILSARVCNLLGADLLVLLSNVEGLYKNIKYEEIIDLVVNIDSDIKGCVDEKHSSLGKGGMYSKLLAAQIAADSNTFAVIANMNTPNVISRIIGGENIGTLFYLNGGDKK